MRRLWIGLLVGLALGYWLWPYAGAYGIGRAAADRDALVLAAHVNEPALKRSLGRQIVAAYLAKSGRGDKMGTFGRGLANAVGTSIASSYLDQLLAPESLAALLGTGHIGNLKLGDRTVVIDRQLPSLDTVFRSNLSYVLLHSFYDGIASFRFAVPEQPGGGSDYGVHVRLNGLTWQLSGLDLPPDVLDRIAADAIVAERGTAKIGD